jgi:hypothetical protein
MIKNNKLRESFAQKKWAQPKKTSGSNVVPRNFSFNPGSRASKLPKSEQDKLRQRILKTIDADKDEPKRSLVREPLPKTPAPAITKQAPLPTMNLMPLPKTTDQEPRQKPYRGPSFFEGGIGSLMEIKR